mgnify:CR=1 FL=1
MPNATYFYSSAIQGGDAARARTPNAQWYNGANPNAGNNSGIGINIGGGSLPEVTGKNSIGYNWTLLQQRYNIFNPSVLVPRAPQGACPVGCYANVSRTGIQLKLFILLLVRQVLAEMLVVICNLAQLMLQQILIM